MIRSFLLLCACIAPLVSLSQEYMNVGIKEFHYARAQQDTKGVASLLADKFHIEIDNFIFSIDEENELFEGTFTFDKKLIAIESPFIDFSIDIGPQEDIWKISKLDLTNGHFEYRYPKTKIGGELFSFTIDGVELEINNSNISCEAQEGIFVRKDIDVDGLIKDCLNNSTITGLGSENFKGTEVTITNSGKNPFELSSNLNNVQFSNNAFHLNSSDLNFQSADSRIHFKNLKAKCYKNYFDVSFNPKDFVNGCLTSSDLTISDIEVKNPLIDINAALDLFQLSGDEIKIIAPSAVATNDEGVSYIESLFISCKKQKTLSDLSFWSVIGNCFEKSFHSVGKIKLNQEQKDKFNVLLRKYNPKFYKIMLATGSRGFDKIKKAELEFDKNNFSLKLKFKALLYIKGKVKGTTEIDQANQEIRFNIESSKIMGIPAKKIILYFLKKFLQSDTLKIEDNVITVKVLL